MSALPKLPRYLIILFVVLLLTAVSIIWVLKTDKEESQNKKTFSIPQDAKKIGENVYDLGEVKAENGETLRKVMIVEEPPEDESEKVKGLSTDVLQATTTACPNPYITVSGEPARNFTAHPFVVDPFNSSGLAQSDIINSINISSSKWEAAARFNFLGSLAAENLPNSITEVPNGRNEIFFADIFEDSDPQTPSDSVGLTLSYISDSGAMRESDVLINDLYGFSASLDPRRFDFETIVIHELGHVAGLGHPSGSECRHTIMFASIAPGIVKRDLAQEDEIAIFNLYNPGVPFPSPVIKPGDINRDGRVDVLDFQLLSNSFGKSQGEPGFNLNADINSDARVDILDFQILSNNFGR